MKPAGRGDSVALAADIGGTKTRLRLFDGGIFPFAAATLARADFERPT